MESEKLIEKYIQNRLNSKEKIEFDELLKGDIDFEKEVIFQTNLKKAVKKEDDIRFRSLISEIETKTNRLIRKLSYIKWLVAASIVLLLGLTYFLTQNNDASTDELFTSYFEPYRNVILPIERGGNQQDAKTLAFMAYEKGDYQNAVKLFSKLYASTKESYYLFYKANALLKLEKANEAIPLLLAHLKTKDTLTEKTNWYLALAYLKLNDKSNAKKVLKKVIADGKFKTNEAKELLKKFD